MACTITVNMNASYTMKSLFALQHTCSSSNGSVRRKGFLMGKYINVSGRTHKYRARVS